MLQMQCSTAPGVPRGRRGGGVRTHRRDSGQLSAGWPGRCQSAGQGLSAASGRQPHCQNCQGHISQRTCLWQPCCHCRPFHGSDEGEFRACVKGCVVSKGCVVRTSLALSLEGARAQPATYDSVTSSSSGCGGTSAGLRQVMLVPCG